MGYIIYSGQFEKGTPEQQAVFGQLLGNQNTQYKFDLYFHWYNIIHEYGHCLCSYYDADTIGLRQEFLVNRFAVSIWHHLGYERELEKLGIMVNEVLQRMENPVPSCMFFTEYYEQIWETNEITKVPIYGYFQMKSVQMALENREALENVLVEMGIYKKIDNQSFNYKEYQISADTAKQVLYDVCQLMNLLGIEQPQVDIEMVDDPSVQCADYVDFSNG